MYISVQTNDFDLSTEVNQLRKDNPAIGAIVSFVGVVRDMNEGSCVSAMELEHYPGMTEQSLKEIMQQASLRWKIIDARIIHRIGQLSPQDQIVLVAVASAHRGEAFAACEFIMDYLKTKAPFWKKESTENGERWVDARESDDVATNKWNANI